MNSHGNMEKYEVRLSVLQFGREACKDAILNSMTIRVYRASYLPENEVLRVALAMAYPLASSLACASCDVFFLSHFPPSLKTIFRMVRGQLDVCSLVGLGQVSVLYV